MNHFDEFFEFVPFCAKNYITLRGRLETTSVMPGTRQLYFMTALVLVLPLLPAAVPPRISRSAASQRDLGKRGYRSLESKFSCWISVFCFVCTHLFYKEHIFFVIIHSQLF